MQGDGVFSFTEGGPERFAALMFVPPSKELVSNDRVDWLALVWKEGPLTDSSLPWLVRWRFNYHVAGSKSVYDFTVSGDVSRDHVVLSLRVVACMTAVRNGTKFIEVDLKGGDTTRLIEALGNLPCVKTETKKA